MVVDSPSLSGTIPQDLFGSSSLKSLNVENNLISGSLPQVPVFSSTSPTQLESIQMDKMSLLSGSLPENLARLSSLASWNVRNTALSGTLPVLGGLTQLKSMFMYAGPKLSGSIPNSLGRLTSIVNILLSGNRLSGSLPASMAQLGSLGVLDLSNCNLEGDLNSLSLGGNYSNIHIQVRAECGIKSLLQGNHFSGSLPDLQDAVNLKSFLLFGNQVINSSSSKSSFEPSR